MSKSEQSILNESLVAQSALPETLVMRNNTGTAWQGQKVDLPIGSKVTVEPNMVILRNARPVKFGLPGSGDIMGCHKGFAISTEIKNATGRQSDIQRNFQAAWVRAGGVYILARSADEAVSKLDTEILLK